MSGHRGTTLQDVAWLTGLPQRRLYGIMHEQETVRFDTADQLLLHLGFQLAWQEDPELREYYEAA